MLIIIQFLLLKGTREVREGTQRATWGERGVGRPFIGNNSIFLETRTCAIIPEIKPGIRLLSVISLCRYADNDGSFDFGHIGRT